MERAHLADYLIDTGQKIPDWLVKIIFLGKAETAISSGIKSRFGIITSTVIPFWACDFSLTISIFVSY